MIGLLRGTLDVRHGFVFGIASCPRLHFAPVFSPCNHSYISSFRRLTSVAEIAVLLPVDLVG